MIRLTSIFGGRLSILRDTLKEVDSRIRFFYLQSDYPELNEYRLKQSMQVKIARCFVTACDIVVQGLSNKKYFQIQTH